MNGSTTERYKKQLAPKEFSIDKYFRIVRKNPDDYETRILLVEELYKYKRIEEAYQQLQILQKDHQDLQKVQQYWDSVTVYRDVVYHQKIKEYSDRFNKDPKDKEAVLKLSEYYTRLAEYDSALAALETYLQNIPEGKDSDVRFKYAQYSAWNYNWEKAIAQLNILIRKDPKNIDYQLLRGQIAVWTAQDFDEAKMYLNNVYRESLVILMCW